jgi:hypothetical protein
MTDNTVLLRQVNPGFVQNGEVTSQVFRPTPKDESQLSTYDGDQITAEAAWIDFTDKGHASVGVQGVTVAECKAQALGVKPDPAAFAEHVLIDFSGCTKGEIEKKSKILKNKAADRGWLCRI